MTAEQAISWLSLKPKNMPVFVLIASDPMAPDTVFFWAQDAEDSGVRPDKVYEARKVAVAMIDYQPKSLPR